MRVQYWGFYGCTDIFFSWSYFILWSYFLWASHMKFLLVRDAKNRTQLNEANQILQPLNRATAKKPYQLRAFTTLKFTITKAYFHENAYNRIA